MTQVFNYHVMPDPDGRGWIVTAEGYAVFFGQAVEAILAFLDGKTPPRVVGRR